MSGENNRMLLELDKVIRETNRSIINPVLPELAVEELRPMMKLVARARAEYLRELLDMADSEGAELPSPGQIQQLAELRRTFEELLAGAQAMETAIQRGYLNVRGRA